LGHFLNELRQVAAFVLSQPGGLVEHGLIKLNRRLHTIQLIEYKVMRRPGMKAVKTRTTTIETLTECLKVHEAVLIVASSAVPSA
jgi:hypothetical protein